ncbi:MAG TPA: hypothetical protein VEH54_03320 [Steroidobacteraceae bacterium]|nr:hypothetical protein [Steroidobacteraceae bacterium]
MQALESQTLILYHTDLRGEWPENAACALRARLPYARRLALASSSEATRSSLAGIALALRALSALLGHAVSAAQLRFERGEKPSLAAAGAPRADFSISHSGPWVGCAALAGGRVGLDIEVGAGERIEGFVAREAALKGAGIGLRGFGEVRLHEGGASCCGELWHARPLDFFPGAAACVMTSRAVNAFDARALPLGELFGP